MTPAEHDLENRRPVWAALSQLFLDTELEEEQLSFIAKVIKDSPYSAGETERILFREVYPVCIANLRSVAGEWTDFSEGELEEAIMKRLSGGWRLSHFLQLGRWMIRDDWNRIKAFVANRG